MSAPDVTMTKMRAATSQVASALGDMAQAVEDDELLRFGNVAAGETTPPLADGLRLLIEATGVDRDDSTRHLHAALLRFLENHP